MKKLNVQQRKELAAAFDLVFKHDQVKAIKSQLFNKDDLLLRAWADFQGRSDFSFQINGQSLTVPFSKIPPALQVPASFGSVTSAPSVSEVPVKRKGRGPGKKQAKHVTSFALEPDLMSALNERAEREERTVSALIRLAIKHYLENVK